MSMTPEQLQAAEADFNTALQAFGEDAILRISQTVLFTANRLSLLVMMVIRQRLQVCGVVNPDAVIRGMLRDQKLCTDTIGEFDVEGLQILIEEAVLPYFSVLAEAQVTLAELESKNDGPKPTGAGGAAEPGTT